MSESHKPNWPPNPEQYTPAQLEALYRLKELHYQNPGPPKEGHRILYHFFHHQYWLISVETPICRHWFCRRPTDSWHEILVQSGIRKG